MASRYSGKGVTIVDKEAWTYGKVGVIDRYYKNYKKWRVDFENGWCGWYELKDLKIG